jgi:hypothetical protein
MRVLRVLLALVAIPFVAGVSQEPYSDPKNCGAHLSFSDAAGARRADAALPHGGKHGVMDRPCAPAPEPEPACPVSAPAATGSLLIRGKVAQGAEPWGPMPGWCVRLTGTVTATAMTRDDGTYEFLGLPDGDYTVCEDLQSGYVQTWPSATWGTACPGNTVGWFLPLRGWSGSLVDFKNIVATP